MTTYKHLRKTYKHLRKPYQNLRKTYQHLTQTSININDDTTPRRQPPRTLKLREATNCKDKDHADINIEQV